MLWKRKFRTGTAFLDVRANLNSVKIALFFLTGEALHAGAEVGESAGGSREDGVPFRVRSCRGNVRRARINSRHISANPRWNREKRAQKTGWNREIWLNNFKKLWVSLEWKGGLRIFRSARINSCRKAPIRDETESDELKDKLNYKRKSSEDKT